MINIIIAIYGIISGLIAGIHTGINLPWGVGKWATFGTLVLMLFFWPVVYAIMIIMDVYDYIKMKKG